MHPTPEQLAALDAFRLRQGRKWKALLCFAWGSGIWPAGAASGYLQQLRNQFGPEWLTAYRPGDTRVGWLKFHRGQGALPDRYSIVQKNSVRMSQWLRSKTAARRAAQADGITLIENFIES